MKNGFFTNDYFNLGDKVEIDSIRVFEDSSVLAKFIDKIFDKYDDHPSLYYTGNVYRFLKNFKRVNRAELGGRADECNKILKYEGKKQLYTRLKCMLSKV